MAHEISVREDGTAEAFFSLKPAWHGLGTVLDYAPDSAAAMAAAHLDWQQDPRHQLEAQATLRCVPWPGHQSRLVFPVRLSRSDGRRPLSNNRGINRSHRARRIEPLQGEAMTIREYNAMRHRLATSAPFQAGERVEIFGTPFESINGKLGTVAEVVRQKAPRPHWRAGVNFDDGCSDSFDCFYLITAEPER